MKVKHVLYFVLFFSIFFVFQPVSAASLANKLSGRILLDVGRNGEAWYVYPEDHRRYYLGRPDDAFKVMRSLGLGISEFQFQQIAQAGMPVSGNVELAKRLAGKIVLEVEKNGEAWYINPVDLKKYYLGRPDDAFKVMRSLGLGISEGDLAQIHKPGLEESLNQYSSYQHIHVDTEKGNFSVDLIKIDLSDPNLKILTLPASDSVVKNRTNVAKPLSDYVFKNKGFAGINGSYFCSSSGCGGANYYFFPIYDSLSGKLVNEDQLKYWTTGPIIAFDSNNRFHYFLDSRYFHPNTFSQEFGANLQAAIGNKPRLIEKGMNALIDWDLDSSQKDRKALRNALGYKENKNDPGHGEVYLAVVHNATVDDLAIVMKALGLDYALNLDGGSSAALIYNDEYMVGPGRDIPNALIFSH